MKNVIAIIIVLLFTCGYSSEKIIFVTGEWSPYSSQKMPGYGFTSEIITAVVNEMGENADIQYYPWKRCEALVESGSVFGAYPYTITVEREKKFLFTEPFAWSNTKFFYYKKKPLVEYNQLQQLKTVKIGGTEGYFYQEMFKNAAIDVEYSDSEVHSLRKLRYGRIDLMPMNELVGWELIKKEYPEEIDNFGVFDTPLDENRLHVMVSKKYPGSNELLERFNQALGVLRSNGTFEKIYKKYNMSADVN